MNCAQCGYEITKEYNEKKLKCPVCGTDLLDTYAKIFLDTNSSKKIQNDVFEKIYWNTCRWVRTITYDSLKYYRDSFDLEQEVKDVINDMYFKVFRNFHQFDPSKAGFRPWFNQIIRNYLCDRFRVLGKNKEDLADNPEFADEQPSESMGNPDQNISLMEQTKLLKELFASISPEQSMCIQLHDIQGMKNKEIADILGISESTVKTRIFYGKKTLEKRGMEMKKKGYSLYGLTPVTLFLWLCRSQDAQAASTLEAAWEQISRNIAQPAADSSAKHSSNSEKPKTTSKGVKSAGKVASFAGKSVVPKVAAGILAGAVAIGGIGTAIINPFKKTVTPVETSASNIQQAAAESAKSEEELIALYEPLLANYEKMLNGEEIDNQFWNSFRKLDNGAVYYFDPEYNHNNSSSNWSYLYYDINQDEIPEFIVADDRYAVEKVEDIQILDIWTLNNETPVHLLNKLADEELMTIQKDGVIRDIWYLGQCRDHYFYQINNGKLELVDTLGYTSYDGEGLKCYRSLYEEAQNPISEEEFDSIYEQYSDSDLTVSGWHKFNLKGMEETTEESIQDDTSDDSEKYKTNRVIPNISEDMISGYQDIITAYAQASSGETIENMDHLGPISGYGLYLNVAFPNEEGRMEMDSLYSDSIPQIQYAVEDVNEDGFEELILSFVTDTPITEDGWDQIQVWTTDGDQVYEVICGVSRAYATLRQNGIIRQSLHGGYRAQTYRFYSFTNTGETKLLEELDTDAWENHSGDIPYDAVYQGTLDWRPVIRNSESLRADGYIFSDSSTRYLTETELISLSKEELALARNEILARHGRIFENPPFNSYFPQQDWYSGTVPAKEFDANYETILNDIEKANIELIKQFER